VEAFGRSRPSSAAAHDALRVVFGDVELMRQDAELAASCGSIARVCCFGEPATAVIVRR